MTSAKPTERVRKVRFEEYVQATETLRKKLAVTSCYNKQIKKSKAVIDIYSSTKSKTSTMIYIYLVFEISNKHVTVQERGQLKLSTKRGNVAKSRYTLLAHPNLTFLGYMCNFIFFSSFSFPFLAHFRGTHVISLKRSGLSCYVHRLFLQDLLNDQTSIKTMNLLSM